MAVGTTYDTDYYALLGVAHSADAERLRDAYLDWSFILHPDRVRHLPPRARDRAEAEMRRLNAAWETLSDPARRADYDAWYRARLHTRPATHAPATPNTRVRPTAPPSPPRRRRRTALTLLLGIILGAVLVAGGWYGFRAYDDARGGANTTAGPPLDGPNLLVAPGFDVAGDDWQFDGDIRAAATGRGTGRALQAPGRRTLGRAYQWSVVQPRSCYALSFWARGSGEATVRLRADWGDGDILASLPVIAPGELWTEYRLTARTDARDRVAVVVQDTGDTGPVALDDFALNRCPVE